MCFYSSIIFKSTSPLTSPFQTHILSTLYYIPILVTPGKRINRKIKSMLYYFRILFILLGWCGFTRAYFHGMTVNGLYLLFLYSYIFIIAWEPSFPWKLSVFPRKVKQLYFKPQMKNIPVVQPCSPNHDNI